MRTWKGTIALENTETGDGRVMAPGALTWAELPLPLAWLTQGDQHVDLATQAPVVGTIETLAREGDHLVATGTLDDDNSPEAAQLVARLDAGTASHGTEQGVSIDLDDFAYQLLFTPEADAADEVVVLASVTGTGTMSMRAGDTSWRRPFLTAAAGDPDPGDPAADGTLADGSVVMFEDASDSMRYRFTRGRIRGATGCAVPAFDNARIALDPVAAAAEPGAADGASAATVTASAGGPLAPPRAWFEMPEPQPGMTGMVEVYGMPVEELLIEQPDGSLAVPLTITDDGRVFGHAARWGQCHVGYEGTCVTAPSSPTNYSHFHVGEVRCEDGSRVAVGGLTVGCDHAEAHLFAAEARDHYAHSGMRGANLRAIDGDLGVWVCGALAPDVTATQVALLQSLAMSGDWRRIGGALEFIAVLAVNVPGFPIAREAITAAAMPQLAEAALSPAMHVADGLQVSLVASGVVSRCTDCQRRASLQANAAADHRLDEALRLLHQLDSRTRHLIPAAGQALLADLTAPEQPATPAPRPRGFVAAPRSL